MEPTCLQTTWFVLFGVLLTGYAVLDGFDLGTGVLTFFAPSPASRRTMARAIGPVWDGNEVWLVTAGGVLFAAFPPVYASVFSGFYLAFMLLLVFLVLRAVALEFASVIQKPGWIRFWDLGFGLGSLVPSILYGVVVGNLLQGLALDEHGNYTGTFFDLLNPYALLVGLQSLAMFVCHGAIYLMNKTDGELGDRMRKAADYAWGLWVIMFAACTVATIFFAPDRLQTAIEQSFFWPLIVLLAGGLLMIPLTIRGKKDRLAFLSSSAAIAAEIGILGLSLYPNLVPASNSPGLSLTAANSSSSEYTLSVMLVIAAIGMPLVIGYTIYIYRVFKGKVDDTHPALR